jgi:hypothetical protein
MNSIPSSARRVRGPVILLLAGALVMSVSGAVGAATPAGWTKINACVNNSTHVVKIRVKRYSRAHLCAPTETQMTWAIRGPQGPQGVQGLQGVPGP